MARTEPTDRAPPPFSGFGPEVIAFFAELDANQNRDWFLANRARYDEQAWRPMASLVGSLSLALAVRDVPLFGTPKASIFRVNRDVRFSREKHPYKTTVSAVLTRDGTKKSQGLLYVQVGLEGCLAALGFYLPDPEELAALRTAMVAAPARWTCIEAGLAKHGLALSRADMVARTPRGIDPPAEVAGAVRHKSLVVSMPLEPADLTGPELVDKLVGFAAAGLPLLEFGWSALATLPPRRDAGGPASRPRRRGD